VTGGATLHTRGATRQARSAEFQTRLRALGLAVWKSMPMAMEIPAIAIVRTLMMINTWSVTMPSVSGS
jgi:hypothetical protein